MELQKSREQLGLYAGQLQALSPLATLERGYSVTLNTTGKVISSIHEVKQGIRLKQE